MKKSYVLIASTSGDELKGPQSHVVATSTNKAHLESLKKERAAERETYLASHTLPDYVQGSLISSEEIQEVVSV